MTAGVLEAPGTFVEGPAGRIGPIEDVEVHIGLGYYAEGTPVARWDEAQWDGGTTTDEWQGAPPVEDISCNVTNVKIERGRDDPLERFRPGTATIGVYDPTGRWSPWRTAFDPSVYSTVRPGIDLIVWIVVDGVRYNRFAGLVDSIDDAFEPGESEVHLLTFHANDYLSLLAAFDGVEQASQGAGELSGARVARIANNAGFTFPRVFDEGTIALQPTTLAQNALDESGLVCDTELGALFSDRDGNLIFRDRNGMITDEHYTDVQAIFGEVEPEICYSGITLETDLNKLKNIVSISNVGGTAVTVTDSTSISLYQPRTFRRFDLIHVDGAQSAIIAQRHLDFYAYAASRIGELDVDLATITSEQRSEVLQLGMLWRIQVRRRTLGVQVVADLQIQGIADEITPERWTVAFRTFDADAIYQVGRWDVAGWDDGLWGY